MSTATTNVPSLPATSTDLVGMEEWTAWVSKLMTQAAGQAVNPHTQRTLAGAAEDAAALRHALAGAASGWLDGGQTDVLRSIYALWSANHDRLERLAASVAPEWHRVWAERSASARLA